MTALTQMFRRLAAATILFSLAAGAQAQTYACQLRAVQSEAKALPSRMEIAFSDGGSRVVISDDVMARAGQRAVEGKIGRQNGTSQILSWELRGLPRNMMPRIRFRVQPIVNYRATLNRETGQIDVRGTFVTTSSAANRGARMDATGTCR